VLPSVGCGLDSGVRPNATLSIVLRMVKNKVEPMMVVSVTMASIIGVGFEDLKIDESFWADMSINPNAPPSA